MYDVNLQCVQIFHFASSTDPDKMAKLNTIVTYSCVRRNKTSNNKE